jgi:peptidyl-prolyl cis-trans isomerase B (cyclophilin B)
MLAGLMRRLLPILLACALVAGCGDDDGSSSDTATTAAAATTADAAPREDGCAAVEPAAPKDVDLDRPTERLRRDATYLVTLTTNCGDIVIELDQRANPKTAASFAHLAREQVFDGTPFHRVVPGFVIQGGDPAANGTGGPGYSVVERPARDTRYVRGLVAMAKTAMERPGTSGSQFFIVTGDDVGLPPDYAVAGEVVEGMDVVDRIEAVPTDELDQPQTPVVIASATLTERD